MYVLNDLRFDNEICPSVHWCWFKL